MGSSAIVTREGSPIAPPEPHPADLLPAPREPHARAPPPRRRPRRTDPSPLAGTTIAPPGTGSSQASAPNQTESAAGSTMNGQTSAAGASITCSWTLAASRRPFQLGNQMVAELGRRRGRLATSRLPSYVRRPGKEPPPCPPSPPSIERSAAGERAADVYSRLLRERLVFVGRRTHRRPREPGGRADAVPRRRGRRARHRAVRELARRRHERDVRHLRCDASGPGRRRHVVRRPGGQRRRGPAGRRRRREAARAAHRRASCSISRGAGPGRASRSTSRSAPRRSSASAG